MKKFNRKAPPAGARTGGAEGIHRASPPRGRKYSSGTNSPAMDATLGDYELTRRMMASLASTGLPTWNDNDDEDA